MFVGVIHKLKINEQVFIDDAVTLQKTTAKTQAFSTISICRTVFPRLVGFPTLVSEAINLVEKQIQGLKASF